MERILDDVRRDALTKLQMSGEDGILLIDTAVNIAEMSDVTRREGLLALEEFNENNNSDFAKWLVMLVVAATDQDLLCEMAVNEYWMRESEGGSTAKKLLEILTEKLDSSPKVVEKG